MSKTLKQRAVRSGSWVIFGHLFSQGLRLGSNLILTRLLVPEIFGVMTIVTVIMVGLAMFSDVGLLQNIVQSKRGEERKYLNTAWTIQIIRGLAIFLIALVLSFGLYVLGQLGWLNSDTVYGNAQLPVILAVVSLTAIVAAFNSINILVLNRKLMMSKLIMIDLVSQVAGLMFMLMWAWYQRDVWALVFGGILSAVVKMLLSHNVSIGERCHFNWDKKAVHEIIHFGKWIFLSSIFGFLLNQGDRILLGGMISAELLGVYSIAFFLANALKDALLKLISSVFFPVLSETVRNSPERLESTYYKIRNKIDTITFFIAGFIFASGETIVRFFYDSRYQDAGWMLQILSLSLVATGFFLSGQCFLAQGNSKILTLMTLIQTASLYILLPFLYYEYGMLGAVWSIVAISLIRIIVSSMYMKIYFFYNIKKEFLMLPVIFIGYGIGVFL
ncbi:hypothetical protein AU255_03800 [Methyloprofundus sedimenti]|uniref:Polysaccharide biosynthesis protein C-terminal domain-containing protein n=1 Tax=Methyloprofundus sedimenti TaxID=1420851 RepID=A0A1V8M664_9GAMM|nr:oligosaccharide flippase family protein [Methyloprofundus sedimenti]OQK17032.1 hypothetical protein AU255_03800 [Methyloprofundus sedimenti]